MEKVICLLPFDDIYRGTTLGTEGLSVLINTHSAHFYAELNLSGCMKYHGV